MRSWLSGLALCLAGLSVVAGCASHRAGAPSSSNNSAASADVADLTWDYAKERKQRLSGITYDLKIDITNAKSKEVDAHYKGDLGLRFTLKDTSKPLRLDFQEGDLLSIQANGKALNLDVRKKNWVEIPASALVEGANTVQITYSVAFSHSGEGFYRFIDPVDNRVYTYTQFEPYDANRFMPCFDQPDLRAVLNLTVLAPKEWVVVTASLEKSNKVSGQARETVFEPTPEISTYLYSLHAGPYAMKSDTYTRADKSKLPLRLFVRESLKKLLQDKEWFQTTKDGIGFYENYFGVRYPFTKLDQVIVPEFNMGGMENVSAIAYTEWILPRSKMTRKMKRNLSSLVLHEIAHMWFGDLVTMSWWNDLWLNESFATYMSTIAQAEATDYKEAWQAFSAGTKTEAYIEDAMITTHPIEATISRTKEAMTNFDGITYNKGASVLKQLNYYMTSDDFRSGVRDYFKAYAYQNTTLNQFIGSLQKHSKKDLGFWADRWLRQSGADVVSASWKCDGDHLRQIDVKLEATPGRKGRPQSFEVALYGHGKTSAAPAKGATTTMTLLQNHVRADFDGSNTTQVTKVTGDWACPAFVYPNNGDHAYALVKLDDASLAYLREGLSSVDDLVTRTMVWNDLWRMVRDTQISLKTYVEILGKNFGAETDQLILNQVLKTVSRTAEYWPRGEASKAERAKFVISMENDFLRRMKAATSGSDDEKLWYDAYLKMAESPAAIDQLYKWYASGRVSKNFPVDPDRAWGIAGMLSRYDHPKAATVIAELKKKDTTDRGQKAALSAEAMSPKREAKQKWVNAFMGPSADHARSQAETEAVMYSIFPVEQADLKIAFSKDFFNYLEKNRKADEVLKVSTVLDGFTPVACRAEEAKRLKETVNKYSDMQPTFKKNFLMVIDEDERCQRIRSSSNL